MGHHSLDNRKITMRPDLDQSAYWLYEKPTQVYRGVFRGYSFPIYNSDNEELYYVCRVPYRWDCTTNPKVKIYCYLASAEDVGDKFRFDLDYETKDGGNIIPATSHNTYDEVEIVTDYSAQYSYYVLEMDLDAAQLGCNELIAGRLRRTSSSGTEISGEVVVMYMVIEYHVDKCFGEWE